MIRDALDQVLRDLTAERYRPAPARPHMTVRVGATVVTWPPVGLEPRTAQQQDEARRILDEETRIFDSEHRHASGRRLKAVS